MKTATIKTRHRWIQERLFYSRCERCGAEMRRLRSSLGYEYRPNPLRGERPWAAKPPEECEDR